MKIIPIRAAVRSRILAGLLLTVTSIAVYAQQESIVLDPSTGNFIITYQGLDADDNPKWQQVTYVPPTKVNPDVRSWFRPSDNSIITYSYRVHNRRDSKQNLEGFGIRANDVDPSSQTTPNGWSGFVTPDGASVGTANRFIVAWSFDSDDPYAGLLPGRSVDGFTVKSSDIPGVGNARLRGATGSIGFPDEGPGDNNPVYPEFKKVLANDHVPRKVAIPLIYVPSPFDATLVLSGIQKHIDNSLVSMALIDPAFAAQLDRLIQAAANSVRLNNPKGASEQIKDALKLLRKEHEDMDKDNGDRDNDKDDKGSDDKKSKSALIDRLAARVLDFDLRYVERRLKTKDDK